MASDCCMQGEVRRPLVLRRRDLERLKAEVAVGGGRSPEQAAEQQQWAEHLSCLRQGSQRLSGDKGCVQQLEHDRLAAKSEARMEAARAERERQAQLAAQDRDRRHSELLARCREMLEASNNAGRRALDSALLFAETLRERQAQMSFDEQLREAQQRFEQQWEERIRSDMAQQDALAQSKKETADERKRAFKEALLKQLEDNAALRMDEKTRMADERQQLDAMQKELDMAIAAEKSGVAGRKAAWRKALQESLEDYQRAQRLRYAASLEEERVAQVFRDMQHKIDDTAKRKQKERIEEAINARKKCGNKIWEAYDKYIKGLQEEECRRRKAQEEEEQRWCDRERMEEDHRKCVVAYRQQGHQEYLQVAMQKKAEAVNNAQYYAALRKRQDEENLQLEKQNREGEHQKRMQARDDLVKQMAERKEQERQEEEKERKFLAITQCLWTEDDNQFFKYANELIQDSQAKGRMLLPLQRAIHEYKKKNYLLPRPARTNTVKSPNKC